ncbi:MAG: fumarylacetoacetate hydrolase family protein [Syntrophomonadaceae bacterium]|nr:fumarylacetoacetate hydrolase family protein [Syntrophomonadaceae bacterium]
MRYARFVYKQQIKYGVVEGSEVVPMEGSPFQEYRLTRERLDLERVKLLPPCQPTKVVCVGLNYADHAREFGDRPLPKEPVLFIKPPSAVIAAGEPIVYPQVSQQVDPEAELAVIIKEKARRVTVREAGQKILGYTCGNDVTARDLQRRDGQWTRSKSFDSFCPLGPWIVDRIDSGGVGIQLLVNGEIRQNSNTSHMIFPVDYLVSYISQVMTLLPGDVIMTGTPSGVGPINPGDNILIRIDGIGELYNPVVDEANQIYSLTK